MLNEIHDLEQGILQNGTIDPAVNQENLGRFLSLTEPCGMAEPHDLSKQQPETVWLVVRHSPLNDQKFWLVNPQKMAV